MNSFTGSRSGYLSTVSARRNEIDALLSNEENISLVKEGLPGFLAAFEAFKEAHLAYSSNLQDEASFVRCQEQFNFESLRADDFCKRVQEWTGRAEEILRFNSQINPEDSARYIGFRTASKSSTRQSRRSNRRGSHTSGTSSLTIARAKEAARMAELKAEAAAFKKCQSLEEQKFRLQHEQERLTLETEIANHRSHPAFVCTESY